MLQFVSTATRASSLAMLVGRAQARMAGQRPPVARHSHLPALALYSYERPLPRRETAGLCHERYEAPDTRDQRGVTQHRSSEESGVRVCSRQGLYRCVKLPRVFCRGAMSHEARS
jgi:hypothetical protein